MSASHNFNAGRLNAAFQQELRQAVARSAFVLRQEIAEQLTQKASNRGATPSPAGSPPAVDTGMLSRIHTDMSGLDAANPKARVGPNTPYARIHEFGGTITSKGKLLTVPLNQEARNMRRRTGGGGLRGEDLVFIKTKDGKKFLAKKQGKGLKFMFALKESVMMPPRPYMRPALALAMPKIVNIFKAIGLKAGLR